MCQGMIGEIRRCLVLIGAVAVCGAWGYEQQVLREGWKFDREEAPGNLRYLSFERMTKWLDFMGRDLLELPEPCLTPESGEPSLYCPFRKPDYDDSKWRSVEVPHDWGVEHAFLPDLAFLDAYLDVTGPGWYRRRFDPASVRFTGKDGERLFFESDGAMSYSMVWVNGHFVGGWPYGYTPWRVELTKWVKPGAENVLAIRCFNFKDGSRWYSGAGLIRECRLVAEKADHIVPGSVFITTPVVTKALAKVHVTWEMTLGGRKEKTFEVKNPRLWDVDDPHLYTLALEDRTFRYGIREIGFFPDARGFQLNGRRVHLRGMCLHHDLGALGAAFNVSAARRRLAALKEAGCNAIRMAHNEPDPKLLDLCDEMGLLVMDEIFDQWTLCKGFNDYARLYPRWWEKDLRRWIRTDRNHPSVIIWGFGNEIMESRMTDEEKKLFKKLATEMVRVVHQEDRTRPATTANDDPKNGFNGYAEIVDIYGFNYRPTHYAKFRAAYPEKPVFGSETACILSTRGEYHFPVNYRKTHSTYGFPYFDFHASSYGWEGDYSADVEWEAQAKTPSVMGDFAWTGYDYLAGTYSSPQLRRHPQSVDPEKQKREEEEVRKYGSVRGGMHTCPTGLFDLAGFRKDLFYLYQSKWRPDLAMCHILQHWNWPERVGRNVPVYVYSTGDEVELFVNGVSQGRRTREEGLWRFVWNDVVYQPGSLRAVAYRKGVKWAEETVRTAGAPARLALAAERPTLAADGDEIGFVTVSVHDAENRLVPRAHVPVKITVSGAGSYVAADNGDESEFAWFGEPERKTFNGLLSVLVRAQKGATGSVKVKVEAPGLAAAQIEIPVR